LTILPPNLKFKTFNSAIDSSIASTKKKGTKANPLMDFLSKGKLNVNKDEKLWVHDLFDDLPHEMRVSLQR
jgi:hypothetical protein